MIWLKFKSWGHSNMGHVWEPLHWKKMRVHGAQKGEEGWRAGVGPPGCASGEESSFSPEGRAWRALSRRRTQEDLCVGEIIRSGSGTEHEWAGSCGLLEKGRR